MKKKNLEVGQCWLVRHGEWMPCVEGVVKPSCKSWRFTLIGTYPSTQSIPRHFGKWYFDTVWVGVKNDLRPGGLGNTVCFDVYGRQIEPAEDDVGYYESPGFYLYRRSKIDDY